MSPKDRQAAVPIGSLWRRGSHRYRIEEHDEAVIVYRNVRTGSRGWNTVWAFVGPAADFRAVVKCAPATEEVRHG